MGASLTAHRYWPRTLSRRWAEQDLGCLGSWVQGQPALTGGELAQRLENKLKRPVASVGGSSDAIERVGWCTGGAQGYFESAIAAGAQAYITGEISEPQAHYARETGVAYLACGHHASGRYGVAALADHVATRLGLAHVFIDIDNPA